MIEIKDNGFGGIVYRGNHEVPKYFGDLMEKDSFNDQFCWCYSGDSWIYLPDPNDFGKRDYKRIVECFRHFGHDLEALHQQARENRRSMTGAELNRRIQQAKARGEW